MVKNGHFVFQESNDEEEELEQEELEPDQVEEAKQNEMEQEMEPIKSPRKKQRISKTSSTSKSNNFFEAEPTKRSQDSSHFQIQTTSKKSSKGIEFH